MVPCSLVSGSLLQLKLFKGFPGEGMFFFGLGGAGAMGARGTGGGAGARDGAGGGSGAGGGGGGGPPQLSMTALFRLLTWK